MNVVEAGLGPQFQQLHPLLQALHRHGGVLRGPVQIAVGRGLAGLLGRRLAASMGVPLGAPDCTLQVTISHTPHALVWARRFTHQGQSHDMVSTFEAVGQWPHTWWVERTGALQFRLGVEVVHGEWHWRVRGARWHGLPVPVGLLPQSRAFKRIEGGTYRFQVAFVMPLLGELLSYQGLLQLTADAGAAPPVTGPAPSR